MILWIGRFEKEKNPEEALRILTSVQGSGIDAGLVMLGEGSLGQKLLMSGHNLKSVSFKGWQDPEYYMARADVVISTSLHESWGASIVEALAAGVPVVAPDVGIAKEAGAIVVEDRKDIAKKVIEVLNSKQRGELKLKLLTAEEWARAWKETLV
jgi:alpha-1,6-mannosyltransferase